MNVIRRIRRLAIPALLAVAAAWQWASTGTLLAGRTWDDE